jgi:hypothetical protein
VKKEEFISRTLDSFKNHPEPETPPFLSTRILANLEKERQAGNSSYHKLQLVIAGTAVLTILNLVVLFSFDYRKDFNVANEDEIQYINTIYTYENQ